MSSKRHKEIDELTLRIGKAHGQLMFGQARAIAETIHHAGYRRPAEPEQTTTSEDDA